MLFCARTLVVTLAGGLLCPSVAWAAGNTSTAVGSATAEIMDPISVTHVGGQALKFGTISVGDAGTVTVSPRGAATYTGGVSKVNGPGAAADQFTVSGFKNRSVSIVTYPGVVSSGTRTMSFTTTPSITSGRLSNGGQLVFSVGGTLSVPAGQVGGTYTGTYLAGAVYN